MVYLICAVIGLEVWGGRSEIKHKLRRLRSVPLRVHLTSLVFRSPATGYEDGKPGITSYHLLKRKGKLNQKSPVFAFTFAVRRHFEFCDVNVAS